MNMTLYDLKERLKQQGEISILEVLEIDSEMLVERFEDLVESKFEYLENELGESEYESNEE